MEEIEIFKELGLTVNEGKVYLALIKHGKLGASDTSRESGVSYSKIYNVLNSLINKGLVKLIPEKSKKFISSNPDVLVELIDRKQEKIDKAREKVLSLRQFYDTSKKNPVVMEVGKAGFYKIVKELKQPKKYNYVIKYNCETKPEWMRNAEENRRKGIDGKNLVRFDNETESDVKKWLKVKKEVRRIDNEGVALAIIDDEEVMISLIKSNITLLIKDIPFTKIMKKMFSETYKNSQPIKL